MYSLPEGQKYNQLQPPPKQELSWFNHNNLRLKGSQKLVESLMNTFKYSIKFKPFLLLKIILHTFLHANLKDKTNSIKKNSNSLQYPI